MAETNTFRVLRLIVLLAAAGAGGPGCGDGDAPPLEEPAEGTDVALIRGRVTDVEGLPLGNVQVVSSSGVKAQTSAEGRFELKVASKVEAGGFAREQNNEVRVAVESEKYSAAELPVAVSKEAAANVEISVKPRSVAMLVDAEKGGRVEASEGFAVELPQAALEDSKGAPVKGQVEVRYALVKSADDVTAAPGRMQTSDKKGLDGFGMAEVRFYKDGQRVNLVKEMQVELPLHQDHALQDGDMLDLFELGAGDLRWKIRAQAMVKGNKVVVRSTKDEWIGAAREQPTDSCVSGRLGAADAAGTLRVANTTIRAARDRGLSLIQVETGADGSFCVPVTPNDDWRVSTFFDAGTSAFALEVALNSAASAGMCGGSGCKQLGDVALPLVE